MEIRIGITDIAREVIIEVTDAPESVVQAYRDAISETNGLLRLMDAKGRLLLIPAARIAYLDLGSPGHRPVGFGAPEQ
ncbi:MAG: DUF3107 domain-containing protein [Propionibacteriaceae bacterium]|nr:DUF3107 domain-containing protein [Propionibacteriaceae bacterium]